MYVDGVLVGKTRVVSRSLNPVWSDGDAEWDVRLTPKSRIKIYIQDYDSFLFCAMPDDPMGEVCFIAENACAAALNRWFDVTPTMGCHCSGRLEVQLRAARALPPPPAPRLHGGRARDAAQARARASRSRRGAVLGVTVERARRACAARAPVFLHVYDAGHSKAVGNNAVGGRAAASSTARSRCTAAS